MLGSIGETKEEVAIELLRTNFDMIRDAIVSLRSSCDDVRRECDALRSKVDTEIMPMVISQVNATTSLKDTCSRIEASITGVERAGLEVTNSINKRVGLFESVLSRCIFSIMGIYLFINISNDLGVGSKVARFLGW